MAAIMLMTGCSQKAETESDMAKEPAQSAQPADSQLSGVTSVGGAAGSDNFVGVDETMNKIKMVEGKLATVYFDFDKYNIRPDMQDKVDMNSRVLGSADASGLTVKVEGNCDEWGTDEYNYALGLKRAKAVRDALIAGGISKSGMIMVSYGESKPACSESSKECWSQNRRVDLKLLP